MSFQDCSTPVLTNISLHSICIWSTQPLNMRKSPLSAVFVYWSGTSCMAIYSAWVFGILGQGLNTCFLCQSFIHIALALQWHYLKFNFAVFPGQPSWAEVFSWVLLPPDWGPCEWDVIYFWNLAHWLSTCYRYRGRSFNSIKRQMEMIASRNQVKDFAYIYESDFYQLSGVCTSRTPLFEWREGLTPF